MQVLQAVPIPSNRRTGQRFAYRERFTVGAGRHVLRIDAYNISTKGLCGEICGMGGLPEGREVEIYLRNFNPIAGRVRWARGRELGLIFTEELANHPRIRTLIARMESGRNAISDEVD